MSTIRFYISLKNILLAGILFLVFPGIAQQHMHFADCWGHTGFNVESSDASGMIITFSVNDLYLDDITVDGQVMKSLSVPGIFLPNNEGAPNLPGTGRYIAIPQGATANVEVLASRTEALNNISVAPSPRIPWENENGLYYHRNMDIYNSNAFYPGNPVLLSVHQEVRGLDAVLLGFTPFQYNPVNKQLIIYKDIRVRITFKGGNGHFGKDAFRSPWFDPLLRDMMLNQEMLRPISLNHRSINTQEVGFEYLIITPNDSVFRQWADTIRKFRTQQGIYTGIVSLAEIGGSDTTSIKNYIANAYNNWDIKPVAVLFLGDYGTNDSNTLISPLWNSYCVSDNIFVDVNHDLMPDMVAARICARNAAELQVMVRKFVDYERHPPVNPGFYAHPIAALGWSTERWFQICTEAIEGFWTTKLNKSPVRVNALFSGNPSVDPWSSATNTPAVVSYFGPGDLGYIPATPQGLGGWTGGTAGMITAALNAGAFMLQHRDHGYVNGWGEPSYSNADISNLTNTDLSFIMSVNCLTGKFNYGSEVFGEKFHRYTYNGIPAGALGLLAASETSYSFVNDVYVWGVYDNMWPGFLPDYGSNPSTRNILPAFGNAAGKYFLLQSSWPYNTANKNVTYNLFHHFGDAFLNVYSKVPQHLTVIHAHFVYSEDHYFTVTADTDALICLSINGEIIGRGLGTGSPLPIVIPGTQFPPDHVHLVVTKQDYYRYEADVPVLLYNAVVEHDEKAFLDIFPNPNDGNFSLKLSTSVNGPVNITIINSLGAIVYEERQTNVSAQSGKSINLQNCSPGLYHVHIDGKTFKMSRKFMIKD